MGNVCGTTRTVDITGQKPTQNTIEHVESATHVATSNPPQDSTGHDKEDGDIEAANSPQDYTGDDKEDGVTEAANNSNLAGCFTFTFLF